MDKKLADQILVKWPEQSREAAEAVVKQYGEPDEATDSTLTWNNAPDASTADPDERILSEAQLAEAKAEGAR